MEELKPMNSNGEHPPKPLRNKNAEEHPLDPLRNGNVMENGGVKQRSRKKLSWKWKIIIACLGILLVGFICVFLASTKSDENKNIPDTVLEELGAYYGKSLNQSANPCDDFYVFACTNLRNEYEKENRDRFNTMAMMEKRAWLSLDDFLTKPLDTSDSATLSQLKTFQQMCINETKVEAEGIEPILNVLKEIGDWPLLSNDWNDTESWEEIVGRINGAGVATQFPFHLQLYSDPKNSSVTAIMLAPILSPTRRRILPDGQRTVDYVKNVTSLLNSTNDRIDDDIKDCIGFESKLYELTNSVVQDGEMHTLESLTSNNSEIAWKSYFRNVFVSTRVEVSVNESIFLSHPKYQFEISKLLNNMSTKIIRNYLVWRLINKAIPIMPEKFREAKSVFQQRAIGKSRNFDCLEMLIKKAKVSMGYIYTKNYFDGRANNKSRSMIKSIENQAYRLLNNITWMDNNTKANVIDTLKNTTMVLPHPNDTIDVMEKFEFNSSDTFFANYRRLLESHRNLKYTRVRMSQEADQRFIPFEYATNADGYYFPFINATFMLASIFQRPFFSVDQPMYLNYGGIGFTIAHEMTHALKISSVCENATCPNYNETLERKECMEKLYDGYVVKQMNETVNGTRTVGENIGDLIGLKLSYRAYEDYVKDSEEQLLPGFDYTERQWFWINAATTLCSYEADASLRDTMTTNKHSPAEARVNVAFANVEEFARDFRCPIGSQMNPAERCGFQ